MAEALQPGNGRPPVPDPTVLTTQLVDRAIGAFREVMETRLTGMDRATELVAQALQAFRAEADILQQRQREATTAEITALADLLAARIGAMDKATELLAATVGRVPSDTDKQVNALRELLGARIDGMDEATKLLAINVREVPTDIDKAARALREILQGEIRNVSDVAIEKFLAIDGTFSSNALALTAALAAQKEAAAEQNKSNTLAITKSEVATKEKIDSNAQQTATSLQSLAARLDDLKERVDRGEGQERGQDRALGSPYEAAASLQAERVASQAAQRAVIAQVIAAIAVLASIISVVVLIARKLAGPGRHHRVQPPAVAQPPRPGRSQRDVRSGRRRVLRALGALGALRLIRLSAEQVDELGRRDQAGAHAAAVIRSGSSSSGASFSCWCTMTLPGSSPAHTRSATARMRTAATMRA